MSRLLRILVALLCLSASTEVIQACECIELRTPLCALFWRSDAVFVGQVIDIRPLKKKPDDVYEYVMVRFRVQESFRGVSGPYVGVGVASNTLCEPKFKKSKRYIVYASVSDKTNQLFTGACRGTGLAVDIDEEVKELRKLAKREVAESISGRVVTNKYQTLAGIAVEAKGVGKTFKTMTTKDGEFSFSPGPGSFTVRVSVPYSAVLMTYWDDLAARTTKTESLSTFEYNVTLEKSECSYLEVDLTGSDPRASATVAGKVLTATGEAVERGLVSLINEVETAPDYRALLKDGLFSFGNVAPGEYHLVLNANKEVPEEFDAPYATTYYPATVDEREATKIQVVEGAVIENIAMRVGPRLTERTVAGRVVWKGGRPLDYPHIAVFSGDKYVRWVRIEHDGTFNFTLYGDFDYSIEARDSIDEIEGRSQRIIIPQGNSAGHKLVIQRIKP